MPPDLPSAQDVVDFWRAAGRRRWFAKEPAFDLEVRARLGATAAHAAAGDLAGWTATATGALALVVLTDQAPRHIHRGKPRAFDADPLARAAAEAALALGHDRSVEPALRPFLYLPFEHAEEAALQARAVALFAALAAEHGDRDGYLRSARRHQEVIARFGRFPHRNAALGRISTREEQAFLDRGGFAG